MTLPDVSPDEAERLIDALAPVMGLTIAPSTSPLSCSICRSRSVSPGSARARARRSSRSRSRVRGVTMADQLAGLSATDIAEGVRSGRFTARAVALAHLDRIAAHDLRLGAFTTVTARGP